MKTILIDGRRHTLSFELGEEVIGGVKDFCRKHKVTAAYFTVIGAVKEVELAWYNLKQKEYVNKTVVENLEIATVTGNVGMKEEEMIIHAHGVFV